ncbi:MAG: alkane 1-monooxygenase [Microscillaceae bacterium]|nr:alkane 1-monooxygenase [Microscillaceae bacterium]MDW8461023.1 alkane 1-monooxygenase [Cytophagales bacterium]
MSIFKKIGFLAYFIIPTLVIVGFYMGGWATFSAFLFAYGFVPLLDELVGRDSENVQESEIEALSKECYFENILHVLVYFQLGIILWAGYVVTFYSLSAWEWVGFTLSLMTNSSGMINVAHELGHKKTAFARFQSKLALLTVCYMHFYIEHNRGHHVRVATPEDPATSRKGQTFYAFWWQSVIGGFLSAWHLEKSRLQKRNLPFWSLKHNEMLRFILFPLLFVSLTTLIFSLWRESFAWEWLVLFFVQSLLAFSSLEAVNYIEHYGMVRKKISENRYERVNPLHSWNSNHLVSNLFLFQLQRHSDHHAYASHPYQILRHWEESPQLPFGYPVMILMSLVPPLWFRVMDKRLEQWQAKQNISTP